MPMNMAVKELVGVCMLPARASPYGPACARAVAANLSRSTLYLSGQSCGFIKHVRYSVFFGVRIL